MASHYSNSRVIATRNLQGFFQDSVLAALGRHQVHASEETVVYLVHLLTRFTRAECFFEWSHQGPSLSPLASLYGEALQSQTAEQRRIALQRLGDVALFVTGLFADSLRRKLVDVGYYIAMGETAYATLGQSQEDSTRGRVHSEIFNELSAQFGAFVDVLADLGDNSGPDNNEDVIKLYEAWLHNGSRRAERKLRDMGITVSAGSVSTARH